MALFPTNSTQIQAFAGALYGQQIGSTTMTQVNSDITAAGGLNNALNAYYTASFGSATTASVAATIVANLGISAANSAAATSYVAGVLNSTAANARGAAVMNMLNLYAGLTADATFGADATAWSNKVSTAVAYTGSTNVAIGSVVSSGVFNLTTGVDSIVGTAGDDIISATNTSSAVQFAALDSVDGGAGVDTLSLGLVAAYTGGATIKNVEKLFINQTTGGGFNATGIAGLTDITTNASTVDIAVTNLGSAANIAVQNQDTAVTVTYADAAVAGSADAVKLTLSNVAQAAGTTITLNNTTTTTGATGIETLTVDLAGAAGSSSGAATIATNAAASLTKIVVTGSSAGILALGTNVTTTALTIDASAATGAVTLSGMGAVANTITMGTGNDSVDMGGNLTSADKVDGGAGSDTIATTAANLNTLNTAAAVLSNVTNFETLRVTDDAASGTSATIDAALLGAANLRLAAQVQANSETVTVNNLGGTTGTANIRLDGAVAGVTLNVKDATLPGTANVVNLDVRGTSATDTFTMNGVETVNVTASSAATAFTLAMTDTALTTLKVTNAGAASFDTGTLGANVNSVDLSAVTGGGATTVTLSSSANTGANVTGTAGVDTITGSSQLDVIATGTGNDVINQTLGADRVNVGSGTDTYVLKDINSGTAASAPTVTSGTTISTTNFDIITGMGVGDVLKLTGGASGNAAYSNVGTVANNVAATAVSFNTTFADNTVNYVRGTYNSSANTFTISSSGADSIVVYDSDATASTSDYNAVVLVGYASAATAANLAAASSVVSLTLFA